MIEYFRDLPIGHYPPDGCALLVRDAWQKLYGIDDLPLHANQFVSADEANRLLSSYSGLLVEAIPVAEHGAMVAAVRGNRWHCGFINTEQPPGVVIHTLGSHIKIESLAQFRRRFDSIEFYRYVPHCRVPPSCP